MPAFNKITKKQYEDTPQIKAIKMTRRMFDMCGESNVDKFYQKKG